jgi:uncharacterized protein YndB with AHSA1/START domain
LAIITRTQSIAAPVEDVFAVVVEGGDYASWNPTVRASRRIDDGEIGEGSRFEWKLKGFGNVIQELQEFERHRRVRIVPRLKQLRGGHRFVFTPGAGGTRIDHELEMTPTGVFLLFGPVMGTIGARNLRDTADALQTYLEAR